MSTLIAKEELPEYKIIPAFVDKSEYWKNILNYGVRLGNEFKGKTHITFETTQGPRSVFTTIWSITDKYLHLKGGVVIALASIIDIHY